MPYLRAPLHRQNRVSRTIGKPHTPSTPNAPVRGRVGLQSCVVLSRFGEIGCGTTVPSSHGRIQCTTQTSAQKGEHGTRTVRTYATLLPSPAAVQTGSRGGPDLRRTIKDRGNAMDFVDAGPSGTGSFGSAFVFSPRFPSPAFGRGNTSGVIFLPPRSPCR